MQKFQNVEKMGLNLWADCCIFDIGNDSISFSYIWLFRRTPNKHISFF